MIRVVWSVAAMLIMGLAQHWMAAKDKSRVQIYVTPCANTKLGQTLSLGAQVHNRGVVQVTATIRMLPKPMAEFDLPSGGYVADITDDHCTTSVEFGVLANQPRSMNIHLEAPIGGKRKSAHNYVYEAPHGELAGKSVPPGTSVWMTSAKNASRYYTAVVDNGAFYFDHIPSGSYQLHVVGLNWAHVGEVTVPGNYGFRQVRLP
jgi:hypothetical protein